MGNSRTSQILWTERIQPDGYRSSWQRNWERINAVEKLLLKFGLEESSKL